jgi:hypothetical protein
MREDAGTARGTGELISRRSLMARGALAGLAAALAQLPGLLGEKGLIGTALAQSSDLTTDTLNGFLAFIAPGNDSYSQHQGQSTSVPGGVGSNTVDTFILDLDHFVPAAALGAHGLTLPASSAVATVLNAHASTVDPTALTPFMSPFSNLSFANKAEVFKRLESELGSSGTEFAFVAGILPGFATFVTFSEAGAFNPASRTLTGRPVGWQLENYTGPADGWNEFRGYYQKRHKVKGAGRNATRRPH